MATLMSKHRTSQPSKRLQSLQFTFFSPTPCTVSGEMLPGSLMGRPSTIPRQRQEPAVGQTLAW